MTACNGLVQSSAAYLLTDGAYFDDDHRVMAIARKVWSFPHQRLAIAWHGRASYYELEDALAERGANTQAGILGALPDVARQMHESNLRAAPQQSSGIGLLIALWDEAAAEPQLWAIESDATRFGPRYVPFALVRLRHRLDTDDDEVAAIFGRRLVLENAADFDVERDGLRLLEAQRLDPWDDPDGRHYGVGGFAQLTRVDADGVHSKTLKLWPDRIGERIAA